MGTVMTKEESTRGVHALGAQALPTRPGLQGGRSPVGKGRGGSAQHMGSVLPHARRPRACAAGVGIAGVEWSGRCWCGVGIAGGVSLQAWQPRGALPQPRAASR